MNISRGWKFSEKQLTPERFSDTLWNFSNRLAANRWNQKQISKVAITRSIGEMHGEEYYLGDASTPNVEPVVIEPIFNEIFISFSAEKKLMEFDGGDVYGPLYNIMSTTTQEIDKTDIPENVLEDIFAEAEDEESFMGAIAEQAGVGDGFKDIEDLETIDIQRVQEVEYDIDYAGGIIDYSIHYSYTFENEVVHEVGFDSEAERAREGLETAPVVSDGSIQERRPTVLTLLNEESLSSEIDEIDTALFEVSLQDVLRFTGLPEEEHRRRILGMVSMLSTGFVKLRR